MDILTDNSEKRSNVLRITALILFIVALVLIVALRLFENEHFREWYTDYADTLMTYQKWVEANGTSLLSVVIILINFLLKAVIPWFPITIIMFSTGLIFKWYYALLINLLGVIILFTVKFYWGKKWGGGNAEKILGHYDKAHYFIESGRLGSKATLFLLRLTPFMPINSVSQLYGTTTMKYRDYILVSLAGFTYKMFSYTAIARNIYNPLSSGFIGTLLALLIVSGLLLLAMDGTIRTTSPIIRKIFRKDKNKHE